MLRTRFATCWDYSANNVRDLVCNRRLVFLFIRETKPSRIDAMKTERSCPRCHCPLPEGMLDGQCPRCLARGTAGILLAGTRLRYFGDYEIIEQLGRGGMGVVYKARHVALDRLVALKMILGAHLASEQDVIRFSHEAQAAALLEHPNIVGVHEVGSLDGQHYFTMRLVDGVPLSAQMDRFQKDLSDMAVMMAKVARAVHHAHQRSVLHRDLKPGNVLMDRHGEPHVADFGLAKRLDSDSGLSLNGAPLGTPSYMAPEQAAGRTRELTTAADIYSLGAMIYHLIGGKPPFAADTPAGTMRQVIESEPPSLRAVVPRLDLDLETICLKCLEKDPGRRYGSAEALAEDLERWTRGEPINARRVGTVERVVKWVRRRPALALLGGATLLLLLVVAIGSPLVAARFRDQQRRTRQHLYAADISLAQAAIGDVNLGGARKLLSAYLPSPGQEDLRGFEWHYFWNQCQGDQVAKLEGHNTLVHDVAFSPDGRILASGDKNGEVILWDVATLKAKKRFRGTNEVLSLEFSPDGALIAVGGRHSVDLLKVSDGAMVSRFPGPWMRAVFFPAGRWLAQVGPSEYWGEPGGSAQLLDYEDGGAVLLRLPGAGGRAAFSADGSLLATGNREGNVALWRLDLGGLWKWIENVGSTPAVALSPSGRTLAVSSFDNQTRFWDTRTGRQYECPSGLPRGTAAVAFSPDESHVAVANKDTTISVQRVGAFEESARLRGHQGEVDGIAFSPNGRLVASCGKDTLVMLWNPQPNSPPSQITNVAWERWAMRPVFTPDESKVLAPTWSAISHDPPQQVLASWDVGTCTQRRSIEASDVVLGYSSDGQSLCTVDVNANPRILRHRDPETLEVRRDMPLSVPRSKGDFAFGLSPDSKYGIIENVLYDVVTGRMLMQFDGVLRTVSFDPDSHFLATSIIANKVALEAWIYEIPSGRRVAVLDGHQDQIYSLAYSPDGKHLVTGSLDSTARVWDARKLKELAVLRGHKAGIIRIAFAPDSRTLATLCVDRTIMLWSMVTFRSMASLPVPEDCTTLSFSPDGQVLITLGKDGILRFWRAGPAQPFSPASEAIHELAIAPIPRSPFMDVEALIRRARSLIRLAGGRPKPLAQAEDLLQQVMAKGTDQAEAWAGQAELRMAHREPASAAQAWERACSLKSTDPELWLGLARQLLSMQRTNEARLALEHATLAAASYPPGDGVHARFRKVESALSGSWLGPDQGWIGELEIRPREPGIPANVLDLSPHYNAMLDRTWDGTSPGNDLSDLPTGMHRFGGTEFDIRGLIQMGFRPRRFDLYGNAFDPAVRAIKVGFPCRRIHFLQAASAGSYAPEGTRLATYYAHHADHSSTPIPISNGTEVADWWSNPLPAGSPLRVVWTGTNPASRRSNTEVRLFKMTWENPKPAVAIETLDLVSDMAAAGVFVVAITVE